MNDAVSAESEAIEELASQIASLSEEVENLRREISGIERSYAAALNEQADELAAEISASLEEGYALGFADAERLAAEKDGELFSALVDIQERYEAALDKQRVDSKNILASLDAEDSQQENSNMSKHQASTAIRENSMETEVEMSEAS